jgi:hypothetical protein
VCEFEKNIELSVGFRGCCEWLITKQPRWPQNCSQASWVHRSLVLLTRGFGRQTSSRWRFSRKNDWIVQVIPQQAIERGHAGALYSKNSGAPAAEAGVWGGTFYYTALGLYGGVLWSDELQGLILHEVVPTKHMTRKTTKTKNKEQRSPKSQVRSPTGDGGAGVWRLASGVWRGAAGCGGFGFLFGFGGVMSGAPCSPISRLAAHR